MDQNSENTIKGEEIEKDHTTATSESVKVDDQLNENPEEKNENQPSEEIEAEKVEDKNNDVIDTSSFTVEELLKHLDEMVKAETLPDLKEMKRLKRMINKEQLTEDDQDDVDDLDDEEDNGEDKNDAKVQKDDLMAAFLNLKTRYHELAAKVAEKEKQEREENYNKKLALIKRLEDNINSTDDFFKVRNEFQNIRDEWKSIGLVPENLRSELIAKYSRLVEEHYTINKLNKEAQEYDFKHNRKEKEGFIEKAKALADEKDIVKAFRELQTLHDLWKETGPVAPEFRENMWKEFKDASTVINRRHDEYFKQLHEQEEANYLKKVEVVERLENMLITLPTSRSEWRNYEQAMDDIRKDWKAAGRVPRSKVNEIRMRFRVAVDEFYLQRRTFMKELSEFITPRLERMRELAQEADELKDSTDWKATSKKLQDMQKEWTEVAKLGTRVTEAQRLWRKFRSACDKFFKNKSINHQQRMASKEENLEKKFVVVEKLEALVERHLDDPSEELAEIEAEWASIGLVPNEKKDEVLNRYYSALRAAKGEKRRYPNNNRRDNRQDGRRNGNAQSNNRDDRRDRRPQPVNMDKNLSALSNPELENEKYNVQRNISQLEDELLQYENNIGFFNASPDNPMIVQIQSKIDALRKKIDEFNDRIKEINDEIKKPSEEHTPTEKPDDVIEETPSKEEGESKDEE